jgi:hypothetical protein
MGFHRRTGPGLPAALAALAGIAIPGAAGAGEPAEVGRVATLHGDVFAERPGEEPRRLGCRDPIYGGERIVTGEDARVGLLMGDLLAHVARQSALRVSERDGEADLRLERGALRVIDPRSKGAEARLALLDAGAEILGNDLEAYLLDEKTGGFAMLCEWDAPLPVARGPESKLAEPGECVIAKPLEPLYVADAHEERLGSPAEDLCPLGPLFSALELVSPTDAAAPPPSDPWSAIPSFSDLPRRSPCDVPGSGCRSAFEPVAAGGEVPGGSGTFTGF